MPGYRDIIEAKVVLGMPEKASMAEIKTIYRKLIYKWHPDRCSRDQDECNEMTRKIIAAYKIIVTYCDSYEYSFAEEDMKKYLSTEEWWFEKFGNDPIWGNITRPK